MAYTYASWTAAYAVMLGADPTDTNFIAIIPSAIDYAEQRIYRELDLVSTIVRDTSAALTPNTRTFTLPTALGKFVVTQAINLTVDAQRVPLRPVSRDTIDMFWPSDAALSTPSIPREYAVVNDTTILVGPAPDQGYPVEVVGTIRPTPLSASNTQTFLTQYLPDIWMAATMIFGAGYQKNFSAMSDDPQAAIGWEQQYLKLVDSGAAEEARKRYTATSWTSLAPSPAANTQRG